MLVWEVNKDNEIIIDLNSYSIYNKQDNFKLFYKYQGDNTLNSYDTDFSEIIEEVNDLTINATTNSNDNKVYVDDVSDVEVGMRFKVKDKEIYFFVEDIDTDNNIIYTRYPINDLIQKDDEINRVGNTGIYQTIMNLDKVGKVLIYPRNDIDNIDIDVLFVEVAEKNEISKIDELKTTFENEVLASWDTDFENNQVIYFDKDGKRIATFNCYNKKGKPSLTNIRKMERVDV
jgi:hypothetical protein